MKHYADISMRRQSHAEYVEPAIVICGGESLTPSQMRAQMLDRGGLFGRPLVHSVMMRADYIGLSAEDRYTVLAFLALRQLQDAERQLIDVLSVSPTSCAFVVGERP